MPTTEPRAAGRRFRYQLTLLLVAAGRPVTVAEMVEALRADGCAVGGRPSKTISDALRREIGRGRVVRVARSTYRIGSIPRSTLSWMRGQIDSASSS